MKDMLIMFGFLASFILLIPAPTLILGWWGAPLSFVIFVIHAAALVPSAGANK